MATRRRHANEDASEDADEHEDAEEGAPGPRSFWSGTLTFGLVSVPVNLYSAYRPIRASLRMLAPDGRPLARRFFCSKDGQEVAREQIVRGYPIEKDRYVVVTDEELERLEPRKSRDIELSRFVDVRAMNPLYFERAYFLAPGERAVRAYQLLASTMEKMGRAGIATFVMRGHEHLIAIVARSGVLIAEVLRFADEVRTPDELGLKPAQAPKAAVTRFRRLIQGHARDTIDPKQLRDEYWTKLHQLAERKRRQGKDVVEPRGREPEREASPETTVIDLMAILKQRLAGTAAESPKGTEAPAPRRARPRRKQAKAAKKTPKRALRKAG